MEALRDPYRDCTPKELQELLEGVWLGIQEALQITDYIKYQEQQQLQQKMQDKMDSIVPLGRRMVDYRIGQLEEVLEKLLAGQQYALCTGVKGALEHWTEVRNEFPTKEELLAEMEEVQKVIEKHVSEGRYEQAAGQQEVLQRLKDKLVEMDGGGGYTIVDDQVDYVPSEDEQEVFYSSRKELEADIQKLERKLGLAVQTKDYTSAGDLQGQLDALLALRMEYPSQQELEANLSKLHLQIQDCIAKKDYQSAGALDAEVQLLQQALDAIVSTSSSTADDPSLVTRAELKQQMEGLEADVAKAVANKNFTAAQELQQQLDRCVEDMKGCKEVEEMEKELQKLEEELEKAIAGMCENVIFCST